LSTIKQVFLSFLLPTSPYCLDVKSASDHKVKVYGQSTIPLNFSGNIYSQDLLVVDVQYPSFDGILGLDFFMKKRADLLAYSKTLLMPHGKVAFKKLVVKIVKQVERLELCMNIVFLIGEATHRMMFLCLKWIYNV
jgi:hypothetical protein